MDVKAKLQWAKALDRERYHLSRLLPQYAEEGWSDFQLRALTRLAESRIKPAHNCSILLHDYKKSFDKEDLVKQYEVPYLQICARSLGSAQKAAYRARKEDRQYADDFDLNLDSKTLSLLYGDKASEQADAGLRECDFADAMIQQGDAGSEYFRKMFVDKQTIREIAASSNQSLKESSVRKAIKRTAKKVIDGWRIG
ncbi:MAG: hypothetical protein AAF750_04850 [Planctomycetota bacterium]